MAFDIETSGQYPVQAEICELGAVKWAYQDGQPTVLDTFESLIAVSQPMPQEVIDIHNISNAMLAKAPSVRSVLEKFLHFMGGAFGVAHHAPFDMGFLAYAFEQNNLAFPEQPVFCSSLLARKLIPDSPRHKLPILAKHLSIPTGNLHRALDDSEICRHIMQHCGLRATNLKQGGAQVARIKQGKPPALSVGELFAYQKHGALRWGDFSIHQLLKQRPEFEAVLQAIRQKTSIDMVYKKGEPPYKTRRVQPIGLALRPNEAFLAAWSAGEGGGEQEPGEQEPGGQSHAPVSAASATAPAAASTNKKTFPKRYYLDKIVKCS